MCKMQSFAWILCCVLSVGTLVECSWGAPGTGQYHIQTDEGPERYFRFQTDNGQFRKEKRLQDGTVIGTEAWIDAAGYLRQKDYIADTKGYRILKSKTVFVGHGRPIEEAIKSTKPVPAQSGILVDGSSGGSGRGAANSIAASHKHHGGYVYATTPSTPLTTAATPSTTTTTTYRTPSSTPAPHTYDRAFGYLSPAEAAKLAPSPYLGFDHYPDELPHRHVHPVVHIRPHADPIDEPHNNNDNRNYYGTSTVRPSTASTPSPPSLSMAPPLSPNYHQRRLRPIAIASTTPAPITAHEAHGFSSPSPFAVVSSSTASPGYFYAPQSTPAQRAHYNNNDDDDNNSDAGDYDRAAHERVGSFGTTPRPIAAALPHPFDINSLETNVLLPPQLPAQHRRARPQSSSTSLLQSNSLGSGYAQAPASATSAVAPAEPEYDGVAVTRNGFRYYLPRQYHEEEQIDGTQKRAGSYGYIDPFGIRRVVYYNASPERGFVHRNNNRYVGFGATPYDPRPY